MASVVAGVNGILMLGAVQGMILGGLLLFRAGNRLANRILSANILFLSLAIAVHTLSHAGVLPLAHHAVLIAAASILVSPLIYLYTQALTIRDYRIGRQHLHHFLPAAAALGIALPLAFRGYRPGMEAWAKAALEGLAFSAFAGYILAANLRLWQYARGLKNNYSNFEQVNLAWLRLFIFGQTLFWILAGLFDVFFKQVSWDIVWLVNCAMIFGIGYFGFAHPAVFGLPQTASAAGGKYSKSALTPGLVETYTRKLEAAMAAEPLYLDKDISLAGLAEKLGISLHHLSQILNESLGATFYDYINRRRIEAAQRWLAAPEYRHQSIAAVGFDAGFNSLSAFNAAFKKFAGQTPSAYRAQNPPPEATV